MKDITIDSRVHSLTRRELFGETLRNEEVENKGPSFGQVLKQALSEVSELQAEADEAVRGLLLGEGVSIHETMIALQKAETSFKLLMEVRNKLISAYNEIMRMQV